MKRIIVFLSLLITYAAVAQSPALINYQAVAHDASGALLAGQSVTVEFGIHQGSATGPLVWEEQHSLTTNSYGLFFAQIGGGTSTGGGSLTSFADIDWGSSGYFLRTEIDAGAGFELISEVAFVSVPYALHSKSTGGINGETINTTGLLDGYILVYNGASGEWEAQAPGSSSFTAGAGIDITSGVISNTGDADNDPTNEIELPSTATTNDVLTWDGTAWVAQAPSGGGDDWGVQVAQTDGSTITGDGTAGSPITGNYQAGSGIDITGATITNTGDGDNDATNEIELPATATTNDVLIWDGTNWVAGASPGDADSDPTNEIELPATATVGDVLEWDGTNWVASTDDVDDADNDPNNEIELPGTASTNDVLIWDGTNWVAGAAPADGDGDSTNEIELPATATTGEVLEWDGTNWVAAIDNVDDPDNDPANELQDITISGNAIGITSGTGFNLAATTPADGEVLTWNNALGQWESQAVPAPAPSELADTDNDTKIQVEESADEDVIRFDISGTELMRLDSTTLHLSDGTTNIFVGVNAGIANTTGIENAAFGYESLDANTTGFENTAIGNRTLTSNTSGILNTAVGAAAMLNAVSGNSNTAIGRSALRDQTTSWNNTAVGEGAGVVLTTGDANTFIGSQVASNKTAGSNNVFVGMEAGGNNITGGGNVFLGFNAGLNETGSSKLFIENSSSATPLIWGDFANDTVKINGTLGIGGAYNFPNTDGVANYVMQTDGAGNLNWVDPSLLSGAPDFLTDADFDTYIDVEQTTDEDFIRMHTAGTERLVIDNAGNFGFGAAPTTAAQIVTQTNTNQYGVLVNQFIPTSAGTEYWGMYSVTAGSGSGTNIGVEGRAVTGSDNIGVRGSTSGTGQNVGLYGEGESTAVGATSYGVFANAFGTGTTNIGIYSTASGATTNYAAHLDGTVRITDGSETAGAVLTSDASGNATWKTNQVAFFAGNGTGSQTITQGVTTALLFQGSAGLNFDTGGNYSSTNGRFTAPVAGVYQLNANMVFAGATSGYQSIQMIHSSGNVVAMDAGFHNSIAQNWYPSNIGATVYLNAGDQVWVEVLNTNGGSSFYFDQSAFSGHLVYAN